MEEIAGLLLAGLPAAVLVVLHMPAYGHSVLSDILSRPLPTTHSVGGVVLTGTLDDSTADLQSIKSRGDMARGQDPNEALFTEMPLSAIGSSPWTRRRHS